MFHTRAWPDGRVRARPTALRPTAATSPAPAPRRNDDQGIRPARPQRPGLQPRMRRCAAPTTRPLRRTRRPRQEAQGREPGADLAASPWLASSRTPNGSAPAGCAVAHCLDAGGRPFPTQAPLISPSGSQLGCSPEPDALTRRSRRDPSRPAASGCAHAGRVSAEPRRTARVWDNPQADRPSGEELSQR